MGNNIFRNGRIIELTEGEVLHNEHESCKALGRVESGRLRLTRQLSSGREIILKEFSPGEIFAELIVFTGAQYPGWLIATEKTTVLEVERKRVIEHLKDHDSLLEFITGISAKLNNLTSKIEIMSFKTVQQKIAYCILMNGSLPLPSVTRTADYLGCSREALSRAISELEHSGAITRASGSLTTKNERLLEELI
ncbi:MAG: Crp/Fnr family transcriptional regulator [Spirochaetales bacterium]|uniref:Crp/Fnr family transcriptional regulator n=1 Tax=Candidatus Thalassospirochaeta sargassi TaxID=3119039 RepID=A0AAJ1IEK3_9SPIO|nr:Crp/Fnr family transcriptional regulator [Spirochaetales bacterium]